MQFKFIMIVLIGAYLVSQSTENFPKAVTKCWCESKRLITDLCLEMWSRGGGAGPARAPCQWWIELFAGPASQGPTTFYKKHTQGRNVRVPELLSLAYVLCLGPVLVTSQAVPGTKGPSSPCSDMAWSSALYLSSSHQELVLWGGSDQFWASTYITD